MTNYDAESGDLAREVEERHQRVVDDIELEFLTDEDSTPVDPVEDATTGQLVEYADSETIASWNLRRIRQALGLSQQQLSDKLAKVSGGSRLSQSQIAKIERGERPWRVNEMFDIAFALGIDHFEFFRGQRVQDDPDLQLLAARLAYQQASEDALRAEEAWHEAEMKQRVAARKVINTAAYLGVKDPEAMKLLTLRGSYVLRKRRDLAEYGAPEDDLYTLSMEAVRQQAVQVNLDDAERWAEEAWERIVQEVQKRKAEKEENE